ncbi:TraV family lipoprotein [Shewanella sp. UCD-KL12]|uniref:TraV family lipoprotein n=1 Tax=Shewanella sp. UCD-KL12 TaxID=1917163 RepID=UPI00097043A3|nr:TraV family lipoprotein [Shewanella sp. UCD-KL12]
MKKLALAISFTLSTLSLSGCMLQVGEDEFSCPYDGKGAACSSARQIHDLTNNRDNLEGLNISNGSVTGYIDDDGVEYLDQDHTEHKHNQKEQKEYQDNSTESVSTEDYDLIDRPFGYSEKSNENEIAQAKPDLVDHGRAKDAAYQPLSQKRYDTFPAAQSIPEPINRTFGAVEGIETEHGQLMVHRQSPMALAPEPLAVLQQPKTMRILVASWTDDAGDLHMPGYVYVEVAPKKWLVGEHANKRPGRIVPLQIQKTTQEEERRQSKAKKGYSSLGITER